MIRYALQCEAGHAFESWFRDSAAFEEQARQGHVACPVCGSTQVGKQIMAPAVAVHEAPSADEVRKALKALHAHVKQNAEDVGDAFADEARRIHYGEADERAIYGQTSLDEAKELVEEGISILPLPELPDAKN
jgi:hypothetical protein